MRDCGGIGLGGSTISLRGAGLRVLIGFCHAPFLSEVARLKTTAGFLLVAVGFLLAVMPWASKSRRMVVSVTFNSCAIKRRDLPALMPIATNLRRSFGEILGGNCCQWVSSHLCYPKCAVADLLAPDHTRPQLTGLCISAYE